MFFRFLRFTLQRHNGEEFLLELSQRLLRQHREERKNEAQHDEHDHVHENKQRSALGVADHGERGEVVETELSTLHHIR